MMIRPLAALAAVVLLVAACSSAGTSDKTADGPGGELQSTRWVLISYESNGLVTVPDGLYADADFRAQRVKGFAGCNDYDGVYRNGGRLLLVSTPILTLKACDEATMAFESTFLTLLHQSRFYNVRQDTLTIRGPDLSVLLVFEAPPANPLLGSWVVDSFSTAPGTISAPLAGTELTAVFRLARVAGSSGCNTFQGPYTTNGNLAAIGPLATTQMACAEDVLAQETSFLAALQGVGKVERRGDKLELQDLRGGTLVHLVRPSAVEASPGPSAGAPPSTAPTAAPSPTPTARPTPTASPTAAPTATPTAAPTQRPSAGPSGTPAPTVVPPASVPPVATCALIVPVGVTAATIVYPANWFTVAAPPELACRYFDPAPITVPTDPATLATAVMIKGDRATSYEDALAAATNPVAWNVLIKQSVTVSGLPATRIEATSTAGSPGFPVGVTRYGYLIDVGAGSAWFETSGTVGTSTFTGYMSVVDLMASQSTITLPITLPA